MNRRRLANKKQRPQTAEATQASSGSNWWIASAAILSTLALIIASTLYLPSSDSGSVVDERDEIPQQTQAASPPPPPTGEQPPGKVQQALPKINLPTQPGSLSVEQAQPALLLAVEQAVERYPKDAQTHYIAALTYAELLQTDRAKTLFETSLGLEPNQPEVRVAFADVLLQTGAQTQAIEVLRAVPPASTTAEVLIALGEAYTQLGEVEQAVETFERGAKEFPDSSELQLRLAQAQNQLQAFEAAEVHARRAIAMGRTDRATYLALSTALLRLGQREEAIKIREQMPGIEEEQTVSDDQRYQESFRKFASHTYSQLGQVYIAHASLARSEALLLQALELEPGSVRGLAILGDMYQKSGRSADALVVYQRLLVVQPENLLNYSNCASLAIAQGDIELAESTLRSATQRDDTGYSHLHFARFLLALGKLEQAATQAEIAVERSEDIDAYVVWIAALQSQGKSAFALDALLHPPACAQRSEVGQF